MELPISEYVKKYYQEHGIVLTDFEKAAILFQSWLGWAAKEKLLMELKESTDNEALRLQIRERIDYETVCLEMFMQNGDKTAVYRVAEYEDGSGEYYFTDAGLALRYGMEHCETEKVCIEKFRLDTEEERNKIGYAVWSKDGKLSSCGFYDFDREDGHMRALREALDDTHGLEDRFEEAFLHNLQYPFERGDIVEDIVTGKRGVLSFSKEDWAELVERKMKLKSLHDGCRIDYLEMMITVDTVTEDGEPDYMESDFLYLDKITGVPGKAEWDVLSAMSRVFQGKETIFNYQYYVDRYVEERHVKDCVPFNVKSKTEFSKED